MPPPHGTAAEARSYSGIGRNGPPGGGDPRMTYTAPPRRNGPPGGGDPRMTYTAPPPRGEGGDERTFIKSPILKRDGEVQGPLVPEGFRSKNWNPRFGSIREFKEWEAFQKRKENMRKNYELIKPFLTSDEDTPQKFSAWYGPVSGSVSVDPTVGMESLIGTAGLNVGPFSGQYTGGPGTNEMIDLAAGAGPFNAYYSPTTDYGALSGEFNTGNLNIGGGIDTLRNKFLQLMYSRQFANGGIVDLL